VELEDPSVGPRTAQGRYVVQQRTPLAQQTTLLQASEVNDGSPGSGVRSVLARHGSEWDLLTLELLFPRAVGGPRAFVLDPSTGEFAERFGVASCPRAHKTGPEGAKALYVAKGHWAAKKGTDALGATVDFITGQHPLAYGFVALCAGLAGLGVLKRRQHLVEQATWARRVLRSLRDQPGMRQMWDLRDFNRPPPGFGPTGVRNGLLECRRQYASFTDESFTRIQHEYLVRSPNKEGCVRIDASREPAPWPFKDFYGRWTVNAVELEVDGKVDHMHQRRK